MTMEQRSNFTDIEIGGRKYMARYYPAEKSLEILIALIKAAGEPVAAAVSGLSNDEGDKVKSMLEADVEKIIVPVVRALAANLHRKETTALIKDILSCLLTAPAGSEINFNEEFKGRPGLIFQLLPAVLKYQYDDLKNAVGSLGELGSILMSLPQSNQ